MAYDQNAADLLSKLGEMQTRVHAAEATIQSIIWSMRDEIDDTSDPETAKRLKRLADQLDGVDESGQS